MPILIWSLRKTSGTLGDYERYDNGSERKLKDPLYIDKSKMLIDKPGASISDCLYKSDINNH